MIGSVIDPAGTVTAARAKLVMKKEIAASRNTDSNLFVVVFRARKFLVADNKFALKFI